MTGKFARVITTDGESPEWAFHQEDGWWGLGSNGPTDNEDGWLHLVREGVSAAAAAKARLLDIETVRWQLPVPTPGKIICLGLNYAAHAEEGGNAPPEYPSFFMRGVSSLLAHESPLLRPRVSD